MGLSTSEALFLGTVLEGFFYGVYCIVFGLYLRVLKRDGRNMLSYPIVALFILCTAVFPTDFSQQFITIFRGGEQQAVPWNLNLFTSTVFSLVAFLSQSVLIYHCWVMWGRQMLIILLPSIFALTSLATSLSLVAELSLFRNDPQNLPVWFYPIGTASFSISTAVNGIVAGLLVLKLIAAHRDVTRRLPASSLRRGNLPSIPSLLMETGIFMFLCQLVYVVLFELQNPGFGSIASTMTMIYGITPTTTIVRAAMRASYDPHDAEQAREHSVGSSVEIKLK